MYLAFSLAFAWFRLDFLWNKAYITTVKSRWNHAEITKSTRRCWKAMWNYESKQKKWYFQWFLPKFVSLLFLGFACFHTVCNRFWGTFFTSLLISVKLILSRVISICQAWFQNQFFESKLTRTWLLSCIAFDDESDEIQVFCISSCFRQFNLPCINI